MEESGSTSASRASKRRAFASGSNLLTAADGFARKKQRPTSSALPALSSFDATSAFKPSTPRHDTPATSSSPSTFNINDFAMHVSEDRYHTSLGAPKFIIPQAAQTAVPDQSLHEKAKLVKHKSILTSLHDPAFFTPSESPGGRKGDSVSSRSPALNALPRLHALPILEKLALGSVTLRTPRTASGFRMPTVSTPGSSSRMPTRLKQLKPPVLAPPTPATPMRSIAPPKLTRPPSPHQKLKTPSTLNIARAMNPSSVDGAALLLSLALEQKGGTDYVPQSQRALVAGLGTSPRKPGEKTPLVKGGLGDAARRVLARTRQSNTLWVAERDAIARKQRVSGGEPPEVRVRVRSVVHVAKGKGGFGSFEPPPRVILLKAVIERLQKGVTTKATSMRTNDEVFVIIGLGLNGTAVNVSPEACQRDLREHRSRIDIWSPWTELPVGLSVKEEEDLERPTLHLMREIAEMPLPSPLDGARRFTQDWDESKGDPVRAIFCERFVVILDAE